MEDTITGSRTSLPHALDDQTERNANRALFDSLRVWLASGDCQSEHGAFYAWKDATTGIPAFEYPEITGYALTHFARREDLTAQERAAGERASDWLLDRLGAGNFSARAKWDSDAIYNFDLGMIATGLITFGTRVAEERYIAFGCEIAEQLRAQIESATGFSSIDPRQPTSSGRSGWSVDGYAHLLKCIQCILLAAHHRVAGMDNAARTLLALVTPFQQKDGRFVTDARDAVTMLHPHLYALEGLWIWGTARQDANAIALARRGIEWAWASQLPTGGFPRFVAVVPDRDPAPEQMDVTSQMLRMALALNPQLPGIEHGFARLREIVTPAAQGAALVYQPASGQVHQNAWVSLFGAQAIEMAAVSPAILDWQTLV